MSIAPSPAAVPQGTGGRYHWTVDTFYRAVAAGVFDEPERLELVHGEIYRRMTMNPAHAALTEQIARRFRSMFEPQLWVREEKPLRIAFDGEPVPDILVVVGNTQTYQQRHPTPADVRLLVEVADSSVEYDTGEKALLYAQAGIEDYWVSLVNARELLVYRNPAPDSYGTPQRLTENDSVRPLAAPDLVLLVRDLLPRPTGAADR